MTIDQKALTRPIVGIENRTAQEVFDIMCDRFRLAALPASDHAGLDGARDIIDAWCVRYVDGMPPATARDKLISDILALQAADENETYEIGKRDGYEGAIADIDRMTGGDGEYRYCTDHDPDRHTPDAAAMKRRIADRFSSATALSAPASPTPLEGVTVKPLEWSVERRSGFNIHVGRGLGLKYEAAIKAYNPGWIVTLGESEVIFDGADADELDAKAAAQADYEARILSALYAHPKEAEVTVTEEMVELAVSAYDEARCNPDRWDGTRYADPMSEANRNSIAPLIRAALVAALSKEGVRDG